jgi:predicted DNA-binding transcriptional regulator YafY
MSFAGREEKGRRERGPERERAPERERDRDENEVGKTERILNLVSCLLKERRPVPWREIAGRVVGYDDGSDPRSLERRFERDKAALKEMGVRIVYCPPGQYETEGYLIPREACFLDKLELLPHESALLDLLSELALRKGGAGFSADLMSALQKLRFDAAARPRPAAARGGEGGAGARTGAGAAKAARPIVFPLPESEVEDRVPAAPRAPSGEPPAAALAGGNGGAAAPAAPPEKRKRGRPRKTPPPEGERGPASPAGGTPAVPRAAPPLRPPALATPPASRPAAREDDDIDLDDEEDGDDIDALDLERAPAPASARSGPASASAPAAPAAPPPLESSLLDLDLAGTLRADPNVEPLTHALVANRRVAFTYWSMSSGERRRREVDPYGMGFSRGAWYVVGRDKEKGDVRQFRLDRIEGAVEPVGAERAFKAPPGFRVRDYLEKPVWEMADRPPIEVEIEVAPAIAFFVEDLIAGKGAAHPGSEPGSARVTLDVRDRGAFVKWALAHLRHVRVVRPPEVREELVRAIDEVRRRHA